MSGITPDQRPQISFDEAVEYSRKFGMQAQPFLLGLRGWANPGQNVRGTYDDAICIVDVLNFETFNANTDPSKFGRGVATVVAPQVCLYKLGIHNLNKEKSKQYPALVQATEIAVTRDGLSAEDTGFFGINIHRGGTTTPGSEGCQTIPPLQWDSFFLCVKDTMKMRNCTTIKYFLLDV